MRKPVLVVVMARTCPACQRFKKKWPNIKEEIKKNGRVDIVDIEVPHTGSPPPPGYHKDLQKFIGWFPTLLLFTGESWNNPQGELKGIIMGGVLRNGHVKAEGPPDFSTRGIMNWIDTYFKNNPRKDSEIVIVDKGTSLDESKLIHRKDGTLAVPSRAKRFKNSKISNSGKFM